MEKFIKIDEPFEQTRLADQITLKMKTVYHSLTKTSCTRQLILCNNHKEDKTMNSDLGKGSDKMKYKLRNKL